MMHELHRFSPTLMLEENDGVGVFLFKLPAHLRADSFLRPVHYLP
jgi:hypothetical protein